MTPTTPTARWKGKARAVTPATEGAGGMEGIVLPLDVVGSGVYDVAYVLPILVGRTNQKTFSLQVDTGSSDLWIASSSCSTSSCGQSGHLYNPTSSGATDTTVTFSIEYLQGSVTGPVYWDRVEIGGYAIDNQALSAASTVDDEPLASNFNGILGLALPLNSVIAKDIPPVTTNDPDGAAWASNLFSITPTTNAASSRFLSLTLSRPGSDRIPATLGIGRHPAGIVQDPSQILYSTLVAERTGTLFWKTSVRAITVYVGGVAMPIELGRSVSGSVFPTAVLDSGVPLILTTSTIANAIYGAIGVSPAADGQYYVPCTTPLNLTITLDNRPETPLHPLDLTAEPPTDNKAQFCIGLIQSADPQLAHPNIIGDMILGVPFMRNTYTVMAYSQPGVNGTFSSPIVSNSTEDDDVAATVNVSPRLGLLSLTDPVTALKEFNTVRILNQPIPPSNSSTSTTSNNPLTADQNGKKLSVGIIVLIGLLGFFALCCVLFGLRWYLFRRKYRQTGDRGIGGPEVFSASGMKKDLTMIGLGGGGYQLAHRSSKADDLGSLPSEDALREEKYRDYLMRKDRIVSGDTVSSGQTQVGDVPVGQKVGELGADDEDAGGEFGFVKKQSERPLDGEEEDMWDPATALAWGGQTVVGSMGRREYGHKPRNDSTTLPQPLVLVQDDQGYQDESPERAFHQRTTSELRAVQEQHPHQRQLSSAVPLLQTQHEDEDDGHSPAYPPNLQSPQRSYSPSRSPLHHHNSPSYPPPSAAYEDADFSPVSIGRDVGEFGRIDASVGGMAGVGTASRTKKTSPDGMFMGRISPESIRERTSPDTARGGSPLSLRRRDGGGPSVVPGGGGVAAPF